MYLSLKAKGLLSSGELNAWTNRTQQQIWQKVRGGLEAGGRVVATQAKAQAASVFSGRRAASSIKHRVYARDRARMPVLQIYSKIPWLGLHETGRTISSEMLVPFGARRMRRNAFRSLVSRLFQEGRAFWVKTGKATVLMARRGQNGPRGDGVARFSGQYGRYLKGQGRKRERMAAVPIAILVKSVTLRKRLRIGEVVRSNMRVIVGAIRAR